MRISLFTMAAGASLLALNTDAVSLKKGMLGGAGADAGNDFMDIIDLAELNAECDCDTFAESDSYAYSVSDGIAYGTGEVMEDDTLAETEQACCPAPQQDMSAINLIDNERNMHLLPAPPQPQQQQFRPCGY